MLIRGIISRKVTNRSHTGWLKIKCSTGQNAISRQPLEIKISEFKGERFSNLEKLLKLSLNIWTFDAIFAICAHDSFSSSYFFLIFTKKNFCNTQIIIITSWIPDKAKVNAKLCYPNLLKNASLFYRLVSFPSRTPAHAPKLAQDWTATTCSEFIGKDERSPNTGR